MFRRPHSGHALAPLLVAALLAGCQTAPEGSVGTFSGGRPAFSPLGGKTRTAVAFVPVIGPTAEAAERLGPALGGAALASDVTVLPAGVDGATLLVKGYFTASAVDGGTAIVYYFDVHDRNGTRIYRISGEERTAKAADPWAAFDDATAEAIAAKTMQALKTLLSQS
ncbi:MAG: hypothetical protein KDJ16_15165 [Hyphomicrobiales bacterium]|nr:hypothetical protein [Hyphomicrobiales bacterium]